MAYDGELEGRMDEIISGWGLDVVKKRMFSGIGYMLNGNMAFGIHGDELIVRTTAALGDELMKRPGVRHFEMGGRASMKNWYFAGGDAIENESKLTELLLVCRDFALTLPSKS